MLLDLHQNFGDLVVDLTRFPKLRRSSCGICIGSKLGVNQVFRAGE